MNNQKNKKQLHRKQQNKKLKMNNPKSRNQ
jgi:hypothetical protein